MTLAWLCTRAKVEVDEADRAVTAAYALEDAKLAAQRRKELQASEAEVIELQRRVDAAGLRLERAQQQVDAFTRERARDLLGEREQPARTIAAELTASVHETLRLARAYVAERQSQDALVAAVPGASPRSDGPASEHAWEPALKILERAVVEVPEVPAPLPRWAGLEHRRQQDNTIRFHKLRRKKKLTDSDQHELQRLGQDRMATPSVATLSNDDAA